MNRNTKTDREPEVIDYRQASYGIGGQNQPQQIGQGQAYNNPMYGSAVGANQRDPRYPVQPYDQSMRGSGAYGQGGNWRSSNYGEYAKKKPY